MARTRGAEADPIEPIEEPELGPIEDDPNAEIEADPVGGDDPEPELDEDGNPVETEPEPEDEIEPEPRRGGGSQTIRAQRARAQAAEERAAKAERELAEARGFQAGAMSRQQQPDPQAAARAEQQFYESLQYMTEEQKFQAVVNRERQQIGGYLQQLQFNQQDLVDQTRFEASCARSPTRDAYREKVEAYRQDQLRRGFVISREEAYHLLLGRDTEARANKARPAQARNAARRVAGQQARPTGARSNMPTQSRRPAPGSAEADWAAIDAAVARGEKVF